MRAHLDALSFFWGVEFVNHTACRDGIAHTQCAVCRMEQMTLKFGGMEQMTLKLGGIEQMTLKFGGSWMLQCIAPNLGHEPVSSVRAGHWALSDLYNDTPHPPLPPAR